MLYKNPANIIIQPSKVMVSIKYRIKYGNTTAPKPPPAVTIPFAKARFF
jgi:hypothetical protein